MTILLLNQNDIPSLTSFSGNIDADKLKPYILLAQKFDVKKALGADLFAKIYSDYVAGTLEGVYKVIYEEYVIDMLVFFSCSKYMTFGGTKVNNNGIYKMSFPNATLLDSKEVTKLAEAYSQLALSAEASFYEYMSAPDTDTPSEWKTGTNDTSENKIIRWY